jgi:hypothetical protein
MQIPNSESGMEAQTILAITAFVVPLTQMMKWAGLPDKLGPVVAMLLSGAGVALWSWSEGTDMLVRTRAWDLASAWLAVAIAAAGVYGYTRAMSSAVMNPTAPPASGAGSSPTVKD